MQNAREYLEKLKRMNERINEMLEEKEHLKCLATDISPSPMDGMPIDFGGGVSQKMQNAVIALIDLENALNKAIDEYIDYKKDVLEKLSELPQLERTVLELYYVKGMTWVQIADYLDYSTMHLWRIRQNANYILFKVLECYAQK